MHNSFVNITAEQTRAEAAELAINNSIAALTTLT